MQKYIHRFLLAFRHILLRPMNGQVGIKDENSFYLVIAYCWHGDAKLNRHSRFALLKKESEIDIA